MRVTCEKCEHLFEIPTKTAGKVEFSQCRNVFRVTYKFRTPCPQCRSVLQLSPAGVHAALGTPISFDPEEVTEQHAVAGGSESTLPRTKAKENSNQPLPTVRVTHQTVKRPVQPQSKVFRVIEGTLRRPKPVHVALRTEKRMELPYLKMLIAGVIFVGIATTLTLTVLAFRQKSDHVIPAATSPTGPVPQPNQAFPSPNAFPIQTGPVGGEYEPVEEAHAALQDPTFYLPLLDRLTSKFGVREDPFNGHPAFHGGIDIGIHQRAEIPAALDGEVVFSGWKSGYGNTVVLKHAHGYETTYGHMTKSLVLRGTQVKQGQPIGLVGSTGRSTGNHLHFEVRKHGQRMDPLRLKITKSVLG